MADETPNADSRIKPETLFVPPVPPGPKPNGRQVNVKISAAVPGSLILFREKTYEVSNDMTVILPADATDEEIKNGGFAR